MTTEQPVMVGARISSDLAKKVEKTREKLAKKNNGMKVSTSDVVRMALQNFVESQ